MSLRAPRPPTTARELATRADLDHLREVQRADLAALEARLTWRFAGAMLAQTLAILGGVIAILRLIGLTLPTDGGDEAGVDRVPRTP